MTHPPSVICVTPQEYLDLYIDLYRSSQIGPICRVRGSSSHLTVLGVPIIYK